MGNTCKPMAVLFQCMTKFTTNKKKKRKESILKSKNKKKKRKKNMVCSLNAFWTSFLQSLYFLQLTVLIFFFKISCQCNSTITWSCCLSLYRFISVLLDQCQNVVLCSSKSFYIAHNHILYCFRCWESELDLYSLIRFL